MISASCTTRDPLPPWFDSFERIPVKSVMVAGHRMAYLDIGAGPPLVLLHGFGGSMWQWEHQQSALAQRFRVITPDLLGAGLSDKPDIEYRPDEMLRFLVGFLDALHIGQATFAGNSMGAGLAIGMALDQPGRVTKLILISGLPAHVIENLTNPSIKRALTTSTPSWLVSFGNWLFGGLMIESILKEIVHDPAVLTPAVIERSDRNRQRPGIIKPVMAARDSVPLWESGYALRISALEHPTLVIWGEEDRVFPIAVGEQLSRTIKASQFIRIPKAGHLPQWERPDLVNQSIIEFLQSP